MKNAKTKVHFVDSYLISPTNPIEINLIGAGGTGSKVLTALMEMNHSLVELEHAGLQVRLWDDDVIAEANLGRQRFAECELGMYKSVALINRINRFSGTNWKAETVKFERTAFGKLPHKAKSTLYISCVDNVASRFEIAEILNQFSGSYHQRNTPKYWMDFGNNLTTGQVILSTIGHIKQPDSMKYIPIGDLPLITDEFGELLKKSEQINDMPSCSLAEALEKQDLYINATLSQMGCSLLWNMFRYGMIEYKGFFLNLKNFTANPIKVA